jgi:hypothetical protein
MRGQVFCARRYGHPCTTGVDMPFVDRQLKTLLHFAGNPNTK